MFPLQELNANTAPRETVSCDRRARLGASFGVFVPRGIEIRIEPMLKIMGYRAGSPLRPAVRRMAERIAELGVSAIAPTVHHCRIGIERCDETGIRLNDGTTFSGPVFAKHLRDCREAIAFIMTLGARFESAQKNLSGGGDNLLEAIFLETAGWVAIEEATRIFTQHCRKAAFEDGLDLSRRLAPGYVFRVGDSKVDWRLEEQKEFFAIFKNFSLPVTLLESCAMIPKMSRTGLFGLRPCAATNQGA